MFFGVRALTEGVNQEQNYFSKWIQIQNRLYLTSIFTLRGIGPFRTLMFGLKNSEASLVRTIINNKAPYHVSIEITNTEVWKKIGIDRFFIQIEDSFGNADTLFLRNKIF